MMDNTRRWIQIHSQPSMENNDKEFHEQYLLTINTVNSY